MDVWKQKLLSHFIALLGVSLLVGWLSFALFGYNGVYGVNHPLQLILVKKINDPHLYPNDAFADTSFSYASVFWYVIAFLSRIIGLENSLLLLFVANNLILVYSSFRVANALYPQSRVAPLACALFIGTPASFYSPYNLSHGSTEQTSYALVFLLLSLTAFIRMQWRQFSLWLGLAANMNVMYALFAVSYFLPALLFVQSPKSMRRHGLIALGGASLIALPAIYLLASAARLPVQDEQAVWQVAELTYPPFFFPDTLGVYWHILFWGLVASAFVLSRAFQALLSSAVVRYMLLWTVVAIVWYAIAWAAPYWLGFLPLLQLHPIRGVEQWYIFLGLVLAGGVAWWVEQQGIHSRLPKGILAVILLAAVAWHYLIDRNLLLVAAALVVFAIVAETVLRVLTSRKASPVAVLAALVVAFLTLSAWRDCSHRARVGLGGCRIAKFSEIEAIAEWARNHTALEDVFLVPVHGDWSHFRYLSERNVFVHRKDGDAWPYAPWYAAEWLTRMELLGLLEAAGLQRERYRVGQWTFVGYSQWVVTPRIYYTTVSRQLDEKRLRVVARSYRVDYWITDRSTPTVAPIVYAHGEWKVVKLRSARSGTK